MSLQSTDPIADLLTRIGTPTWLVKPKFVFRAARLKKVVAEQLKKTGYLTDVKVEAGKPRDTLVVTINKDGENATFTELTRMSKPGRRMYVGANEIPRVKSGRGIVLISTCKGV